MNPYRLPAEREASRRWGVTRWRRILFRLRYLFEPREVRNFNRRIQRLIDENERMSKELERMKLGVEHELPRLTRLVRLSQKE